MFKAYERWKIYPLTLEPRIIGSHPCLSLGLSCVSIAKLGEPHVMISYCVIYLWWDINLAEAFSRFSLNQVFFENPFIFLALYEKLMPIFYWCWVRILVSPKRKHISTLWQIYIIHYFLECCSVFIHVSLTFKCLLIITAFLYLPVYFANSINYFSPIFCFQTGSKGPWIWL